MQLQAPPFDATPDIVADWIELKVLSNRHKRISFSTIERVWEARRESEDSDYQAGLQTFDDWSAPVYECLQRRLETLGASYPFAFGPGDAELYVPDQNFTTGARVYLLCLFLSSFIETEIFETKVPIPPRVRNLFQSCSAWAAAGAIHGSSYAFGWPRLDASPMLAALRTVYGELMNDGESTVVDTPPAGSSLHEKDSGIDVIAWRERIDRSPGKVYMLGQVASGKNWRNKSVQEYIDVLHNNWFVQNPVSSVYMAMFIPFAIRPEHTATLKEQLRMLTTRFGALFYRDVLPAYAAAGVLLANNIGHYCDRLDDVPKLEDCTDRYVKLLERAHR